MDNSPRCFISYSWDDDLHRDWVKEFASRLRQDGVITILDRWHAIPGDQLPEFMEKEIRESDYVLIICSPKYKKRSDNRKGGVGYEGDIITGEIFVKREIRKFIPILRTDDWENSAPSFLMGKYYIDLSSTPYSEENYKDLLLTLFGMREDAPPLGEPPIHVLKEYAKLQKKIDQCNWAKFEFVDIPVISDSEANRKELMLAIRDSLIRVYENSYKSFSIIFFVKKEKIDNHMVVRYSLAGHEKKFIYKCYEQLKELMLGIITARRSENWQEFKEKLLEKQTKREEEYSEWRVFMKANFSERPEAINIVYDPELKRIKINSDSDLFTDPKMYDSKIKTTSEAIRYTCAVVNLEHRFFGDIGWQLENLPLYKMFIYLLDHNSIDFRNFRFQIENSENWDYVNPSYEAEIKGYS